MATDPNSDSVPIIYEHSTDEEISGVFVDGMGEMMGDDILSSDWDADTGDEWPGVNDIDLPEPYQKPDQE
jgi:hypothetical protein